MGACVGKQQDGDDSRSDVGKLQCHDDDHPRSGDGEQQDDDDFRSDHIKQQGACGDDNLYRSGELDIMQSNELDLFWDSYKDKEFVLLNEFASRLSQMFMSENN